MRRVFIVFASVTLLVLAPLHAQQVTIQPRTKPGRYNQGNSARRADTDPSPTLRVDTSLLQVPVTVTDKLDRQRP